MPPKRSLEIDFEVGNPVLLKTNFVATSLTAGSSILGVEAAMRSSKTPNKSCVVSGEEMDIVDPGEVIVEVGCGLSAILCVNRTR